MKHCTELQLDGMLDGWLESRTRISCRVHLLLCADCRRALRERKSDRAFLDELREGFGEMDRARLAADALDKQTNTDMEVR